MRGRKNPTSNQTPPNLPPCKVCGEQGTGFHYGVTACGACKGFFRRSLVRKQPYVCNGHGDCVIGPETKRRKSCPKCRHDKCLSVGMSKDAIKTGRYSYVKKSHDIIEMIEHHFHHFVKRKQLGDYKMSQEGFEDDLDISVKKSRSSCALEKISEAFRKPSHGFMELSPTKSVLSSQTAFSFDDSNMTTETVFPVTEINDFIDLEKEKMAVMKDGSVKSDAMSALGHMAHNLPDANGSYSTWCTDTKSSEFAHYFNSPPIKPCQTSPTSSTVSLSSPMSDVSNSRGSSASVSTSWLEFPNYSDSLYTEPPSDETSSFLDYSDTMYSADIDGYSQQQSWNESLNFSNEEYAVMSKDRSHIKHSLFDNQTNFPFQSFTSEQDRLHNSSINIQEYNPFNKHTIPAQNTEFNYLHTPVSNELEQLRRLSWDDMSFSDDLLCPDSGFITDKSITHPKNKSLNENHVTSYFPSTHNTLPREKSSNAESMFAESSTSSYWDLDATTSKSKDAHFVNITDHYKEHFHLDVDIKKSCTPYDSSMILGSYYRERQNSDSSVGSSNMETRLSPAISSSQQTLFDYKSLLSKCEEVLTADRTNQERHYIEGSLYSQEIPELFNKGSLSVSSSTSLFSTFDLEKDPEPLSSSTSLFSTFDLEKDPENVSEIPGALTLEDSMEPVNFLNIPFENSPHVKQTGKTLINKLALESLGLSVDSDDYSPEDTEITPTRLSQVSQDDSHLEKWTPFSLSGEAPRSIEPEDKPERIYENEEDYKGKPLPWCEFTEAELDEVVMSLKTAYQKHVVIDSHLLSDEEIAEKLKSFLDILELREQTYGKLIVMDREAYFNILEATGIDVGGRRDWTETHAKILNRTLQKTVRFFRSVPGFKDVCHEDKIILAKSCLYEYVILSCYRGVNLEKQVILDAEHKYAISMDLMKLIVPEMEDHMLDMLDISRRLMDLKLSFEETLILKAISITSPDRDKIQDFEKVERMYWRLHCCLILSLWRRMTSPWPFYARVISVLTDLRGLAYFGRQIMSNLKPDIMKLTKDIQVPLYLEMLFSETD